ncbi:MAG: cystathionine beta-lyase [Pseudomonadota bacterium]
MSDRKPSTKLIHQRGERLTPPTVNPPVEHASTVLFSDPDDLYSAQPAYGRMGLTVHRELEATLAGLERAEHVRLAPNGLGACALAIASLAKSGDHVLIVDTLYGPTRRFCERRLKAMGVSVTRFHPRASRQDLEALLTPQTRAIFLESPGSLTFELPDTLAIAEFARSNQLTTIMDNTWGAGLFHKPLELGVDISVQALTKYAVGHADAFGGAVMTNDRRLAEQINACSEDWGISLGPDDAYVVLRGLRTLETRLKRHEASGIALAEWLQTRPEIQKLLHPALSDHPDHAIWKRDFSGACGLFGVVLRPTPQAALNNMLKRLELFGMGFSWGGYESLLIPCDAQLNRHVSQCDFGGQLLRIHAGLEDPGDLIADLSNAFQALT